MESRSLVVVPLETGRQAARRACGHLGRARPARGRGLRARLGARAAGLARARPRRPPPAAQDSLAQLQAVIAQLPLGVAITDADHHIVLMNDELERIWGAPVSVGYDHRASDIPTAGWPLERAIEPARSRIGERREIERDAETRTLEISAAPVRDADGRDRLRGRDPRRRHAPQPRGGEPSLPRPGERAARREPRLGADARRDRRARGARARRLPRDRPARRRRRAPLGRRGARGSGEDRARPGAARRNIRRRSRRTRSRSPYAPASRSCCRTSRPRPTRWRTTPSTRGRSAGSRTPPGIVAPLVARGRTLGTISLGTIEGAAALRRVGPRDGDGARAADLARARQRAPLLRGPGARPRRRGARVRRRRRDPRRRGGDRPALEPDRRDQPPPARGRGRRPADRRAARRLAVAPVPDPGRVRAAGGRLARADAAGGGAGRGAVALDLRRPLPGRHRVRLPRRHRRTRRRADEDGLRLDRVARAPHAARRDLRRGDDAAAPRRRGRGVPARQAARGRLERGRPARAHRQRHPLGEPARVGPHEHRDRAVRRGGDHRPRWWTSCVRGRRRGSRSP